MLKMLRKNIVMGVVLYAGIDAGGIEGIPRSDTGVTKAVPVFDTAYSVREPVRYRAVQFSGGEDVGLSATSHTVMPQSSCQDLILASPGTNLADVMKLQVEAPMSADAGRYQDQVLV